MAEHDQSYRLLFSYPRLVADLLGGFVPGLGEVDSGRLERAPAQYVTNGLAARAGDLAWRLRSPAAGGAGDLVVLLEFQSTVDRFMALRVHTYLGLLAQSLHRGGGRSAAGRGGSRGRPRGGPRARRSSSCVSSWSNSGRSTRSPGRGWTAARPDQLLAWGERLVEAERLAGVSAGARGQTTRR